MFAEIREGQAERDRSNLEYCKDWLAGIARHVIDQKIGRGSN
jgi:hypothetical protein